MIKIIFILSLNILFSTSLQQMYNIVPYGDYERYIILNGNGHILVELVFLKRAHILKVMEQL